MGGCQLEIRACQHNGTPNKRSLYSIKAPTCIGIGCGVRIRKRSSGGVMRSRLAAPAKKAKIASRGSGKLIEVLRTCVATPPIIDRVRSPTRAQWIRRLAKDGRFSQFRLENNVRSGRAPQSSLQLAPFYLVDRLQFFAPTPPPHIARLVTEISIRATFLRLPPSLDRETRETLQPLRGGLLRCVEGYDLVAAWCPTIAGRS